MAEIKKVDFSRFLQNQDFTLHGLIIAEVNGLTDPKVKELITVYKDAYAKYDKVLKTGGKSPYSIKLSNANSLQDKVYTGMAAHVRAMLNHFDPEKAEIAYAVDLIMKKYGNPCRLPYLQEDAVIKNLIQDLEKFDHKENERPEVVDLEDVSNRLEKIGLTEWIDQLKARNAEFMVLYTLRNAEDANVVTGATKQARKETDTAGSDVIRRINSLADVNGEADYITVINEVNRLIEKECAVLAAHRTTTTTRNKKKKEEDNERPDVV